MEKELLRYIRSGSPIELIYLDRHGRATKRTFRLREIAGDRVKAY